MRAFVLCAVLVLLSIPTHGATLEQLQKEIAKREAAQSPQTTRDFRCGKTWITFPVIGFNSVIRKQKSSDQIIWNAQPHVKTLRKSKIYGLNDTALILIQEPGTVEHVYGVSAPVRDAIIACLD